MELTAVGPSRWHQHGLHGGLTMNELCEPGSSHICVYLRLSLLSRATPSLFLDPLFLVPRNNADQNAASPISQSYSLQWDPILMLTENAPLS